MRERNGKKKSLNKKEKKMLRKIIFPKGLKMKNDP